METMQPWATGFNRPKPLPTQMNPQRSQPVLSREEMLEAKRLAEESNFSYAGYQVVRREFVSHRFDPAMTVKVNSITFNNACIKALVDATYVQFLMIQAAMLENARVALDQNEYRRKNDALAERFEEAKKKHDELVEQISVI